MAIGIAVFSSMSLPSSTILFLCLVLFDPKTIGQAMQELKSFLFGHLLRSKKHLPPPGCSGLMGFNLTKAGIFVAEVAKTGYQTPFVGTLPSVVDLFEDRILGS